MGPWIKSGAVHVRQSWHGTITAVLDGRDMWMMINPTKRLSRIDAIRDASEMADRFAMVKRQTGAKSASVH